MPPHASKLARTWFRAGAYGTALHHGDAAIDGLGAGFEFFNSYEKFKAGDNTQGALDGLSGGLDVLIIVQPESLVRTFSINV